MKMKGKTKKKKRFLVIDHKVGAKSNLLRRMAHYLSFLPLLLAQLSDLGLFVLAQEEAYRSGSGNVILLQLYS